MGENGNTWQGESGVGKGDIGGTSQTKARKGGDTGGKEKGDCALGKNICEYWAGKVCTQIKGVMLGGHEGKADDEGEGYWVSYIHLTQGKGSEW